jgi:hypothetical protein
MEPRSTSLHQELREILQTTPTPPWPHPTQPWLCKGEKHKNINFATFRGAKFFRRNITVISS